MTLMLKRISLMINKEIGVFCLTRERKSNHRFGLLEKFLYSLISSFCFWYHFWYTYNSNKWKKGNPNVCACEYFDNNCILKRALHSARVYLIPFGNWIDCVQFEYKVWATLHCQSVIYICNMLILLYILHIIMKGPTLCFGNMVEEKILKVGEELWRETLPLHGGSCFYQLQGLKPHMWYEVKISYPASIPASFSIQLKKEKSDVVLNNNRRLLNTEKLIFKAYSDQDETPLLLVTVEPEGFPAKLHVPERQFIIFNIVCDELLLGIPHKAWWVVALALLCLGIAFIVPSFLPLYLLPRNQVPRSDDRASKTS